MIGETFGRYQVVEAIGSGGMGIVYRAHDVTLDRDVALKLLHAEALESPVARDRFLREARALSHLNHPHICTLYDVGQNFIVMELVEGETIAARLKNGPLPMNTALLYASQIVAALAEAHGKGIVHRDLNPANIMIAKSGI